jgi:hypothetical protein
MHEHTSGHAYQPTGGRAILVLVLVVGLIVAALLVAPMFLNMQWVRDALLHEFEQRTGHRLAMERIDLRLFPRPRLELRQVEIFDQWSEVPLLAADRLDAALQIWPLLGGRFVAAYVVVDRPRATVRHDRSGRWTIESATPDSTSAERGTPVSLLAMVRHLLIVDGRITILEESRQPQPAPLQLVSLQATMTEEIPGRKTKIQLSGELLQEAGRALINIDGSFLLLDGTAVAGGRFNETVPVQAEGSVRIHQLGLRHMAEWFGMPPSSNGLDVPARLTGQVRLVLRPTGYDLIVADWRVGLSELSLQGAATLSGLGTDSARLSATLSASPMPIKQMLTQMPPEWLSEEMRNKFAQHAVDGFVTLRDTHLSGAMGAASNLTVTGEMEIRDGRFVFGGTHPVVRDLSATVHYDLEQIRVVGIRANYGPVRFSDGNILITDWRKEPTADVRIAGEARAADMVALALDRGRFPEIDLDLSQLEQVSGDIRMATHWSGQPAQAGMKLIETSVTISNLGFRHVALPIPFRQIQGRVTLLPTEVRLDGLHGQAGFARVEAGGRVMLAGEPVFQDMVLKLTAEGEDIAPWLQQAGTEDFRPDVKGPIFFSAAVSGLVGMPRFKGALTLDGTAMEVPHVFTKAKGAPAGIQFDGQLTKNRLLSVRRGELIFPPVRIVGEGSFHLADDLDFRMRIVSEELSMDKLPKGVRFGPIQAGVLKAGLKMEGKMTDRASWLTSGRLHFKKGIVKSDHLHDPVRDLTMGLRFDGRNIDIRSLAFNIGESDIRISGSIADWMEAPRGKLVVESSQIDVAALKLTGRTGSSSTEAFPVLRSWWTKGSLEVTLLIDHAYYERFLLTGLSCRVRFAQGTLTIDRISGDTNEGHLGGRLALTMPERGPATMRSAFHASGLPVERLLALVEERPRVSGWMTVAGRIQAEFEGNRLRRSSVSSRRPISIIIEDGHLYYAPAISKILSVMSLPAILEGKVDLTKEGMPLDRLKIVFSVEDGIIRVNEFLLDSPILKISGTGRYDFIGDQFDGVVVTSPLGQYSDLLKGIPLFGKLFAGERQGFDTAIFKVKGPANDPDIEYLAAESLMAGAKGTAQLAFDLLVNAITLPKEAFSMAEDLFADDEEPAERF